MTGRPTPPVGLLGEFTDLTLHCARRTWVMHVELPFDAFDTVTRGLGLPPAPDDRDDPHRIRTVAILSCRGPVHPEREGDVLAEAALRLLQQLLEAGRLSPVRATTIDRFRDVMDALGTTLGLKPQTSEER